jgi:hypothetical protein
MITPYGKHYASLYRGSLYGKGAIKFAVMGYVIASQAPLGKEKDSPLYVELNPAMIADIFGESEKDILEAIGFLCAPDVSSRSKEEQGRRLVQEGQFTYRVVNGRFYRDLADEERRAESARIYTKRYRARQMLKARHVPSPGEREYIAAFDRGATEEELEKILEKWLPTVEPKP